MKNNTFEKIGKIIDGAEKILIYPHVHLDGDAAGSAAALCSALRKTGKTCYVLIEDEVPANLMFLTKDYFTFEQQVIKKPDLSICIDCGDESRFAGRKAKFHKAPVSICIDHHATTKKFCDYNYVDKDAAAAGQLVYHLLQAMHLPIDKEIGEALFAAITTDTGNFQYSNTEKETHQIVAALYDAGIDAAKVSAQLYENQRLEKILIRNKALETMSLIAKGKGVIAYVTQEMLKETGARMDETDTVVQDLRSIGSVDVAALLKEMDDHTVKVSLRSKHEVDVAQLVSAFSGGGHARAAGCTLNCSLAEAFDLIREKMADSLGKAL